MGIIENRKSIRKFRPDTVSRGLLEELLHAAMLAPSPKNRQPWYFIVAETPKSIGPICNIMEHSIHKLLAKSPERRDIEMALETVDVIRQAPVLIFVCYRYGAVPHHNDGVDWPLTASDLEAIEIQSIGGAVENMLLKAEELGLSSLWCGDVLYAYQDLMEHLSAEYPILSAVCIGYSDEHPSAKTRLPWGDLWKIVE